MPVKTRTYTTLAERLKRRLEAVRSLVTGEVATLKVRIESLQAEVAKLEATAASHRADYERERDRADRPVVAMPRRATGALITTRSIPLLRQNARAAVAVGGRDGRNLCGQGAPGCACESSTAARTRHRWTEPQS